MKGLYLDVINPIALVFYSPILPIALVIIVVAIVVAIVVRRRRKNKEE